MGSPLLPGSLRCGWPRDWWRQPRLGPLQPCTDAACLGGADVTGSGRRADRENYYRRGVSRDPGRERVRRHTAEQLSAPDRVPGSLPDCAIPRSALIPADQCACLRASVAFMAYGLTHGRIDPAGMLPQAPSSDTTGWFARDADTFARVSGLLLDEAISTALPSHLIIAVAMFSEPDGDGLPIGLSIVGGACDGGMSMPTRRQPLACAPPVFALCLGRGEGLARAPVRSRAPTPRPGEVGQQCDLDRARMHLGRSLLSSNASRVSC